MGSLGYVDCFVVNRVGQSGGLALLCKKSRSAKLLSQHKHYIDVKVKLEGLEPYRMTGFYNVADRNCRRVSWEILRGLSNGYNMVWVITGDFNDILYAHQKRGRCSQLAWLFEGFREPSQIMGDRI